MKTKLNFDEAIERVSDGRYVDSSEVQTRALRASKD